MQASLKFICMMSVVSFTFGCKKKEEKAEEKVTVEEKSTITLSSAIFSSQGTTTGLKGAVLLLVDRTTSLGYAAELDASGKFSWQDVDPDRTYTIVFLNKNRVLLSALNNDLKPYFKFKGGTMPYLVLRGPSLIFASTDEVEILSDAAKDTLGNNIPDGIENLPSIGLQTMPNQDIDGDGLLNVFDPDDDDDSSPDLYDPDWPGAMTLSLDAPAAPPYGFTGPLQDVSVSVTVKELSSSVIETSLRFLARVPDAKYLANLSVMGAEGTFTNSLSRVQSDTGEISTQAWDQKLSDDGNHGDGSKGDGWFGANVVLAEGKDPRHNEVVLFKMEYKNSDQAESPLHTRFAPILLPKISTTPLAANFSASDSSGRTIEVSGTPFGVYLDYTWSVQVVDSEGVLVHESQSQTSAITSYTIPDDATDAGKTYKVKVSAELKPRYLGYPDFVIQSAEITWSL